MNGTKKWYKSKTLWLNAVAFAVAVVGPVLVGEGYTGAVPAGWAVFVPAVAALLNGLLRLVTEKKLTV